MIQKNPFLKYVMKDKKEDVFHSSAYAKAQNGGSLGAASTESYQVRVNINQNRTRVKGYGDSELMMGAHNAGLKAKAYTPPANGTGVGAGVSGASVASARAAMPTKNPGISIKK